MDCPSRLPEGGGRFKITISANSFNLDYSSSRSNFYGFNIKKYC